MQRPILKGGVVVNVVEIDEDTTIVTKEQHKELHASEDAEYETRLSAWRAVIKARQEDVGAAVERLSLAKMTLSAVKTKAAGEKQDTKAALALTQILSMEAEIEAHEQGIAKLRAQPLPPKPKLLRGKRWFHPADVTVGPVGGNIGDRWDGRQYVRPEKARADA